MTHTAPPMRSGLHYYLEQQFNSFHNFPIETDLDKLDADIFHIDEVISIKERFYNGENLGVQVWFLIMYQMWGEEWL